MTAYGSHFNVNCHTSPSKVFKLGKAQIWAGRWPDMQEDLNWDLRIRLNDDWMFRAGAADSVVSANAGAKKLFADNIPEVNYPPTINVSWDDFGTPPLEKEWWVKVVEQIAALEHPTNIAVYCQGGHGRTGTALAIMASLGGLVPPNMDCVEFVRKHYCQEVVESWAQMNYIQDITGEELMSYPTSHWNNQGRFGTTGSAITGAKTPSYVQQEDGSYTVSWNDPTNVTKEINSNTSMFNHAAKKKKRHHDWKGLKK